MAVQARVQRPHCRRGVIGRAYGLHRAGLHLQFVPQGSGLFQHKLGIAMPAGLASGGAVVQAGQIGLGAGAHQHVGADVGQQVGPGGRADLVVNHFEGVPCLARRSMVLAKLPPRAPYTQLVRTIRCWVWAATARSPASLLWP